MVKISKDGEGKTLYVEISVFPNNSDPTKNLTISCSDPATRFKTTLTDNGLKKFREKILDFYSHHVLEVS